jgi:hypothetical protein
MISLIFRQQPNANTQSIVAEQWIRLILAYARHRRLFTLRIENAETIGGDWDEILRNERIHSACSFDFSEHPARILQGNSCPHICRFCFLRWCRRILLYTSCRGKPDLCCCTGVFPRNGQRSFMDGYAISLVHIFPSTSNVGDIAGCRPHPLLS